MATVVRAHTRQRGARLFPVRQHMRHRAWRPGDPRPEWSWEEGEERFYPPFMGEVDEELEAEMEGVSPEATIWMTPAEFWALSLGGLDPNHEPYIPARMAANLAEQKGRAVLETLRGADSMDPVALYFGYKEYDPETSNGYHRAAAAHHLGIERIPVEFYGPKGRKAAERWQRWKRGEEVE